jgi:hypothetical protein
MGRIDWLRDVGTGLGKDVLAIALEIWVIFDGKRRMARIDWAKGGERNGGEGYGGRKETGAFGQGWLGREMGKYENGQKRLVLPIYITEKATMQASVIVIIVRHIRQ